MKYVSRSELGWPPSAAPNQAIPVEGFKIHYEGTHVPNLAHKECASRWTAIRNSHLANKAEGYSDVAYNWAVCNHGTIFEGRGWGKQTGANGSQILNRPVNAILWMGGSSGVTVPSAAAVASIKELIQYLRLKGAGKLIAGHRDGFSTSCPGDAMYSLVKSRGLEPDKDGDMEPVDVWAYKGKDEKSDAYAYLRNIRWEQQAMADKMANIEKLIKQLLAK